MKKLLITFLLILRTVVLGAEYQLPIDRRPPTNFWQNAGAVIPDTSGWTVYNAVTTYGADPTGVADSQSEIQACVSAAAAAGNAIAYIPAGTYRIGGGIVVPGGPDFGLGVYSNWVIRGDADADGNPTTIFEFEGSSGSGIVAGVGVNWADVNRPNTTITSGLTSGSTSLIVSDITDAAGFTANKMGRIVFQNDPSRVWNTFAGGETEFFQVHITGVTAGVGTTGTLTIDPPIPFGYTSASTTGARIVTYEFGRGTNTGIENIYLQGTNATGSGMEYGIRLDGDIVNGWIKNCRVMDHTRYAIWISQCVRVDILDCWVEAGLGSGSSRAGVLIDGGSSYGRMLHTIVDDNQPCVEIKDGVMGQVYAYNYIHRSRQMFKGFNTNHGPQNMMNLYEGNVSNPGAQSDGYFGGESAVVFYRNWFTGVNEGASGLEQTYTISLKRMTRFPSIVGNILCTDGYSWSSNGISGTGEPNIGNSSYVGTVEPSTASWWIDTTLGTPKTWTGVLTTRTSDTAGVVTLDTGLGTDFEASLNQGGSAGPPFPYTRGLNGNGTAHNFVTVTAISGDVVTFTSGSGTNGAQDTAVTFNPSPGGFQQLDEDVANTMELKGNFGYDTDSIPAGQSLGGDTLPNSLFLTTAPDRFTAGGLTWPPFDPTEVLPAPSVSDIPAGYRFLNGMWPTSGGAGTQATVTNTTTVTGTLTLP